MSISSFLLPSYMNNIHSFSGIYASDLHKPMVGSRDPVMFLKVLPGRGHLTRDHHRVEYRTSKQKGTTSPFWLTEVSKVQNSGTIEEYCIAGYSWVWNDSVTLTQKSVLDWLQIFVSAIWTTLPLAFTPEWVFCETNFSAPSKVTESGK